MWVCPEDLHQYENLVRQLNIYVYLIKYHAGSIFFASTEVIVFSRELIL